MPKKNHNTHPGTSAGLFNFLKMLMFVSARYIIGAAGDASQISWSSKTLAGGQYVEIDFNNAGGPFAIIGATFTTTDNINTASFGGSAWWPGTQVSSSILPSNKMQITTQEPSGYSIPSGASSISYANNNGTNGFALFGLPIASGPDSYSVIDSNGNTIALNLADMCQGAVCNDPSPAKISYGYLANWNPYNGYQLTDVVKQHNMINYFALGLQANGNVIMTDTTQDPIQLPQLKLATIRYPNRQYGVTVGGQNSAAMFAQIIANNAQWNLIGQIVNVVKQFNLNYVSMDIETLDGSIATSYANFLVQLNKALAAVGTSLHVDLPAGYNTIMSVAGADPLAFPKMFSATSYQHLMAYDMHGVWGSTAPRRLRGRGLQSGTISDFQAALNTSTADPNYADPATRALSVDGAITTYRNLGVNTDNVILLAPAYGRSMFVTGTGSTQGLWQPLTGQVPPGAYNDSTGIFPYSCIVNPVACSVFGLPADTQFYSPDSNPIANVTGSAWGYSTSQNIFVTFDNVAAAIRKAQYVVKQGLAGMGYWLPANDMPAGSPQSLIDAMVAELNYVPPTPPTPPSPPSPPDMTAAIAGGVICGLLISLAAIWCCCAKYLENCCQLKAVEPERQRLLPEAQRPPVDTRPAAPTGGVNGGGTATYSPPRATAPSFGGMGDDVEADERADARLLRKNGGGTAARTGVLPQAYGASAAAGVNTPPSAPPMPFIEPASQHQAAAGTSAPQTDRRESEGDPTEELAALLYGMPLPPNGLPTPPADTRVPVAMAVGVGVLARRPVNSIGNTADFPTNDAARDAAPMDAAPTDAEPTDAEPTGAAPTDVAPIPVILAQEPATLPANESATLATGDGTSVAAESSVQVAGLALVVGTELVADVISPVPADSAQAPSPAALFLAQAIRVLPRTLSEGNDLPKIAEIAADAESRRRVEALIA